MSRLRLGLRRLGQSGAASTCARGPGQCWLALARLLLPSHLAGSLPERPGFLCPSLGRPIVHSTLFLSLAMALPQGRPTAFSPPTFPPAPLGHCPSRTHCLELADGLGHRGAAGQLVRGISIALGPLGLEPHAGLQGGHALQARLALGLPHQHAAGLEGTGLRVWRAGVEGSAMALVPTQSTASAARGRRAPLPAQRVRPSS